MKNFKLNVAFGTENVQIAETNGFASSAFYYETKAFKTQPELNAYVDGLNDSNGWDKFHLEEIKEPLDEQKEEISRLLEALYSIQESVDKMGVKSKEISWCNDLYDEVKILYLNDTPDGDYQSELYSDLNANELEKMSYEDARKNILNRISNMLQTVEGI